MTATVAGYLLLAVAAALLELWGRLPGARTATIDDCVDPLLHTRLGRMAVLAAWLWIGWHLFAR